MGPRLNIVGARRVLLDAVAARAFPAAVVEVGDATTPLWQEAFGRLTYDAGAPPTGIDSVFDIASLTKVVCTAPLTMLQVERGKLGLDDKVSAHVACWEGLDRADVTIRDLLSHTAGLQGGWVKLFLEHAGREAFARDICARPLEYSPRRRAVYSDLGFMLLGFLLDTGVPLDDQLTSVLAGMGIVEDLRFLPPAQWRPRTAPTEFDHWRGRLLVGEVHDENAAALGGVAGHAGLFGTAPALGAYARHLLQVLDGRSGAFRRDTLLTFIDRRTDVPNSSRGLAWDTMLPTSSCGTRMSARAFGHTGFTGTSLWIDPVRGLYVVLLTNRVYPNRENLSIAVVRPAMHDALLDGT